MTTSAQEIQPELIPYWRSGDSTFTKLPRGGHKISREDVVASQKGRILRATLELIGEEGPAMVSISDVARRAKVSRKSFYAIFQSFDDCLRQAFVTAHLVLGNEIAAAVKARDKSEPYARIRAMVTEFFAMATEEPVMSVAVVGTPYSTRNGVGPLWTEVRKAQIGILSKYWTQDLKDLGKNGAAKPRPAAKLAAIALISTTILDTLAADEQDLLLGRVDEVVDEIVHILSA
jgi:AcrR family transcriptional regulator